MLLDADDGGLMFSLMIMISSSASSFFSIFGIVLGIVVEEPRPDGPARGAEGFPRDISHLVIAWIVY